VTQQVRCLGMKKNADGSQTQCRTMIGAHFKAGLCNGCHARRRKDNCAGRMAIILPTKTTLPYKDHWRR